MTLRRVVVLAFPGAQALDIVGPVEVLDTANRLLDQADDGASGYQVEIVSARSPLVATCSGVVLETEPLEVGKEPIDTLLLPGGWGTPEAREDPAVVSWIQRAASRSQRIASVCGGAFLLAEAGLLAGRRATTHWAYCDQLAERFPDVIVDPKPIFVRDGNIVTSAGVSAGIDMTLALVEEDHGPALALEVARWLVLFLKRTGGQAQFSPVLDCQLSSDRPIRETQEWILENLEGDLSVPQLASRASMSPRNFARVFRREVGLTPAQYVERMRVSHARELLETTDCPIGEVARRCGFRRVETFLRSFGRVLEVTPEEYRSRFHLTCSAVGNVGRAVVGGGVR